ncbi:MAG: DUF2332 domain-containing protein [Alphaproteobacteria bacterium]|nr:DUF2332 domain-containing protein [Alphaproteobacteria bacterium]
MSDPPDHPVRAHFRAFAREQARGKSDLYEGLAEAAAASDAVMAFVAGQPPGKRQANLFLAALRFVSGLPDGAAGLERAVARDGDRIAQVMRTRSTQTNEPGRCAYLAAQLAALPGPVGLIEVGASAGLCLYPDLYSYAFSSPGEAADPGAADVVCTLTGRTRPGPVPEIAHRVGVDLNPLDARTPADRAWLETLIWPEQTHRLARLRRCIERVADQPPAVIRGDAAYLTAALIREAPKGLPLVVANAAALVYMPDAARRAVATAIRESGALWLSQEAPGVAASAPPDAPAPADGLFFVAAQNGVAKAWANPHGDSLHWLPARPDAGAAR